MKKLVILGSTGSIGTQTLEIVKRHPDLFIVDGLTALSSWESLARQALWFMPRKVALGDPANVPRLREALEGQDIEVLEGEEGINEVASMDADVAVVALVGVSGLVPTIKAIRTGKTIALANKEALVVGGDLVMEESDKQGVSIIPIDSEHSAIFQCLRGENRETLKKVYLTSSGGPFRTVDSAELKTKTASDALKHPTWDMGKKVTIDSATLMNKGFEVIEACHLFDLSPSEIEVLIHPQSVIHSMVEFIDGSIKAQMSLPDMRIPIQYALTCPGRIPTNYVNTNFIEIKNLTFESPRADDFPCLNLAYEAMQKGGTMPAVLNGANETAVQMFLDGKIGFMDIPKIISTVMEEHKPVPSPSLDDLLSANSFAMKRAEEINKISSNF